MDKIIRQAVMERSQGLCELCESNDRVEPHHIIKGRGKRLQHETKESVIALCWGHHHGTDGVHGKNGYKLDLKLKIQLQQTYFNQGYTEEKVRKMMGGKLYDTSY